MRLNNDFLSGVAVVIVLLLLQVCIPIYRLTHATRRIFLVNLFRQCFMQYVFMQ